MRKMCQFKFSPCEMLNELLQTDGYPKLPIDGSWIYPSGLIVDVQGMFLMRRPGTDARKRIEQKMWYCDTYIGIIDKDLKRLQWLGTLGQFGITEPFRYSSQYYDELPKHIASLSPDDMRVVQFIVKRLTSIREFQTERRAEFEKELNDLECVSRHQPTKPRRRIRIITKREEATEEIEACPAE